MTSEYYLTRLREILKDEETTSDEKIMDIRKLENTRAGEQDSSDFIDCPCKGYKL